MSINMPLITIGYDKNGEMDFGVLGTVAVMPIKDFNELRQTIVVAIGVAEDMWRRNTKERIGKVVDPQKKETR